jgi:alpha-ketoglutarate-dependent taurine dioxygenase
LKKQDINAAEMQDFLKRFHTVAGAPKSAGLHIHPSINVNGGGDEGIKIQKISSEAQKKAGGNFWRADGRKFWASEGWHSDVSWEKAPADYSMLKLVQIPKAGGDTMFASGEALYERLSPSFAAYLETLEAVHAGSAFVEEVQRNGGKLYQGERGVSACLRTMLFSSSTYIRLQSPFNQNQDLTAVHPVVRTNPVTGKKAIFVNRSFTKSIVGLTPFESDLILKFLYSILVNNHDIQARIRWEENDLASESTSDPPDLRDHNRLTRLLTGLSCFLQSGTTDPSSTLLPSILAKNDLVNELALLEKYHSLTPTMASSETSLCKTYKIM